MRLKMLFIACCLYVAAATSVQCQTVDAIPIGYLSSGGDIITTMEQEPMLSAMNAGDDDGTDYTQFWLEVRGNGILFLVSGTNGSESVTRGIETFVQEDGGVEKIYLVPAVEPQDIKCESTNCSGCLVDSNDDGEPINCTPCGTEGGTCKKTATPTPGFWDRALAFLGALGKLISISI